MRQKFKKRDKIYVLGASGAGTTTFANQLSKILKIPHYDMDDVRFIKKFTKARTPKQRKKRVDKLLKKRKWIFDARGTNWDRHAMNEADIIIWMQTPAHKRIFRIIKRYFKRKEDNLFEEDFSSLIALIKYSLGFRFGKHITSFNSLKEFLEKNKLKPIIIKNKKQLNKFSNELK